MAVKSITLYGHATGPNPWKIAMVLEELEIPYEMKIVPRNEIKGPAYEAICVNGRAPTIQDPNTGTTLWESGAIIEYLTETYDKSLKLGFERGTNEYWIAKQWLYFQVSGQGPYFGQLSWFSLFHPEKIASVQERYINEVKRVTSVLNRALEGKQWLVGEKFSFADISFLTWYQVVLERLLKDSFNVAEEAPNVSGWLERMKARPAVQSVIKAKTAAATAPTPSFEIKPL